jgi:hypothetical protein
LAAAQAIVRLALAKVNEPCVSVGAQGDVSRADSSMLKASRVQRLELRHEISPFPPTGQRGSSCFLSCFFFFNFFWFFGNAKIP